MNIVITIHAAERIQGRTKLQLKDVLSGLNSGKAVEIACPGATQFMLFYSPPDKCTKLALVDKRTRNLISIWESDYKLPRGRRVTNSDRAKAYSLAFPGDRNIEIQVCYKEKAVYAVPAGKIAVGDSHFLDTTIAHIATQLRLLVALVNEQVEEIQNRTTYDFRFSDPETGSVLSLRQCISHRRVDSFLPYPDS